MNTTNSQSSCFDLKIVSFQMSSMVLDRTDENKYVILSEQAGKCVYMRLLALLGCVLAS